MYAGVQSRILAMLNAAPDKRHGQQGTAEAGFRRKLDAVTAPITMLAVI